MSELTLDLLKKLYKKCKKLAIPRTIDGKYWIIDDKTRKAYNKKIKENK